MIRNEIKENKWLETKVLSKRFSVCNLSCNDVASQVALAVAACKRRSVADPWGGGGAGGAGGGWEVCARHPFLEFFFLQKRSLQAKISIKRVRNLSQNVEIFKHFWGSMPPDPLGKLLENPGSAHDVDRANWL